MRRFLKPLLLLSSATAMVLLLASTLGQWVPGDAMPAGAILTPGNARVTVEVRNAGGVGGMARTATDYLRSAGFDVVGIGNAARFDQTGSVVIDRVGTPKTAAGVAGVLGIDSVTSEPDPNLFVDVTVRLGSGWVAPRKPEPIRDNPAVERVRRPGQEQGNEY